MREISQPKIVDVDEDALADAEQEVIFEVQAAVDADEQKRFERASQQAERYIEDRLLVLRRRRQGLTERLEQARARRDSAPGSEARSEAERAVLSVETSLAEVDGAVHRLESRDDETFQQYQQHIHRRRYTPPRVERLFDVRYGDRMTAAEQRDDVMLKLVHTADWHLGRQFRSFPEDGALKLSRARLEVLDRILLTADRYAVDAVLCAGDLFDEPNPLSEWWEQTAARLRKCPGTRPVFLLPGNHDPLTTEFCLGQGPQVPESSAGLDPRRRSRRFPVPLPKWCRALCGALHVESRPARSDRSIPKRATGDEGIRIGMVHGSTFDAKDWQTNFPIHPDAVLERGLDYLAIGDTHGFRFIPPGRQQPPTIYPGAPEATAFDEKDPGCVAVVFVNRQRVATVRPERVARWTWEERTVTSIDELRALVRRTDLGDRVLRLHVNMKVPAPEYDEAEMLIEELQGTLARHARAGVLELDRNGLELETATVDQYCGDLPGVLRSAVTRLTCIAEKDPAQRLIAERALFHLYRSAKRKAS